MSGATPPVSTIVKAGAGAGKTTELVRRAFDFANNFKRENNSYPRLVICTYTRKATQELRERMMAKACEIGDWDLLKYFSSSQVQISTIHGILSLFLGRYGFRSGLDPRYKIIDDNKAVQMAKDLVRNIYSSDLLVGDEKGQLLKNLGVEKMAEACLQYYEGSLASPELKPHDEDSLKLALREFEAQLQSELETVIADWQEIAPPESNQVTFNEILANLTGIRKIIKDRGILEGRELLQQILADGPRLNFGKNKEIFLQAIESLKDFKDTLKKTLEKPAFELANIRGSVEYFNLCENFFKEFAVQFKDKKKLLGQIQIGDLELLALDCIRAHPETAQLFSTEWDYWLIDEYQDTSPIQVQLLNHLVGRSPHFVVGDPQQSIYLFRGARSEVFAAKEKMIVETNGEHLNLNKNYRSQKRLVQFFNEFFASVDSSFTKLEPMRDEFEVGDPDVKISLTEEGQEFSALCGHVKKLLANNVAPEDICILARDNKKLKLAAKSLSRANVPSLLHSASGFYERREILDALSLLKFILNPFDDVNLVQLLRSPWFWVSDQVLVRVLMPKDGGRAGNSAWEFLIKSEFSQGQPAIIMLREILVQRENQALSTLFRQTLLDLGFFDFAQRQDVTGRREANLWKFILNLEKSSRESGFNFIDFVTQSEREIDLENAMEQDAVSAREVTRVNLMTVHQSKGLEFPYVILLDIHRSPNLTKWLPMSIDEDLKRFSLPLMNSDTNERDSSLGCLRWVKKISQRELDESKRLLYVALTRAEKKLIMIGRTDFERGSWGDLISWDLSVGDHQKKGFNYRVDSGPLNDDKIVDVVTPTLRVRAKYQDGLRQAEPVVSVSEIVKKDFKAEGRRGLSRNHILNRAASISAGIQVHRILELLQYSPDGINNSMIQKMYSSRAADIVASLDYIRNLETPPMMKILKNGFAEWGYLFKEGDRVIEGQIDLWGEVDTSRGPEAWIIDYKTGSPEYKETARLQLLEYTKALRAFGITKPIRLAAVYPMIKTVEVWES